MTTIAFATSAFAASTRKNVNLGKKEHGDKR